jgi:hypothetical protein
MSSLNEKIKGEMQKSMMNSFNVTRGSFIDNG